MKSFSLNDISFLRNNKSFSRDNMLFSSRDGILINTEFMAETALYLGQSLVVFTRYNVVFKR